MSKIDYELYQVKNGEEHLDYLFTSLSLLKKLKLKVDQCHYDRVYSGSVESSGTTGEVLESLFMKFNLEFPADYRSRSMSVSDVVVLHKMEMTGHTSAILLALWKSPSSSSPAW